MNVYISPYVQATFREQSQGFISRCEPSSSCPPYVIARAAIEYLELGVEIDTAGYTLETLERITAITGHYYTDVRVDFRQATELATIGRSLLEIHQQRPELRRVTTNMFDTQDVWPILDPGKVESIQWLIRVVERAQ